MTDTQKVLHSLTTILSSHVKVSGGRLHVGECAACDDAYDLAQAVLDALPALGYVRVGSVEEAVERAVLVDFEQTKKNTPGITWSWDDMRSAQQAEWRKHVRPIVLAALGIEP